MTRDLIGVGKHIFSQSQAGKKLIFNVTPWHTVQIWEYLPYNWVLLYFGKEVFTFVTICLIKYWLELGVSAGMGEIIHMATKFKSQVCETAFLNVK